MLVSHLQIFGSHELLNATSGLVRAYNRNTSLPFVPDLPSNKNFSIFASLTRLNLSASCGGK